MQLSPTSQIPIRSCEGLDSETFPVRAGLPRPPVVCTAMARVNEEARLYSTQDQWGRLMTLLDSDRLIVGHNLAYDLGCYMEWGPPEMRKLIFSALDNDRIIDTMLAEVLVDIETGSNHVFSAGLDEVSARYGLEVDKSGTDEHGIEIRTGYAKFLHVPISEYPVCYRRYASEDASIPLLLIDRILSRGLVQRSDLAKMARIYFGFSMTSAFGLRTDPLRVDALEEQARTIIDKLQDAMIKQGFMRDVRNKPHPVRSVKVIQSAVAKAYGMGDMTDSSGMYKGPDKKALQAEGLITKTGRFSYAGDVLENSGCEQLAALADYGEWSSVLNKDIKLFREAGDLPFHTRFGFAATTRSTSSGPNIQNFRNEAGPRECIRALKGAFVFTDFCGLENGTLAQTVVWALGRRGMADKISSGWDFHCDMGAHILGISYEDMVARCAAGNPEALNARGSAKPLNFGLVGFMTRATTVAGYARKSYGVDLPVERWQELINLWYATQHDQVAYLNEYVDSLRVSLERRSLYSVPIPSTGIIRRGAIRTAAANTGFQGLGAQVAGYALYLVVKAQLLGQMPGRASVFVHDEIGTDCKPEDVPEVDHMQSKLMIQASDELMPDVRAKVDSKAVSHWSKGAKASYAADGTLTVTQVKVPHAP